ncbi:hypothetical protein P7C70_g1547, partial [Phenoliferia sp. Uapishka_3]
MSPSTTRPPLSLLRPNLALDIRPERVVANHPIAYQDNNDITPGSGSTGSSGTTITPATRYNGSSFSRLSGPTAATTAQSAFLRHPSRIPVPNAFPNTFESQRTPTPPSLEDEITAIRTGDVAATVGSANVTEPSFRFPPPSNLQVLNTTAAIRYLRFVELAPQLLPGSTSKLRAISLDHLFSQPSMMAEYKKIPTWDSSSPLPLPTSTSTPRLLPHYQRRYKMYGSTLVILILLAIPTVFTLTLSPYSLTLFLEATVPCAFHLQAKCFTSLSRDWEPRDPQQEGSHAAEEQQHWLDKEENWRFREQCGDWREWTKEFEERQRKVMSGDTEEGVVIWKCDSFSSCHGWGDRLRGLQTTFLLALLSENAFMIKSDRPSPLSLALRPASNDLTFDFEDLRDVIPGRSESTIRNDNKLWETASPKHRTWRVKADIERSSQLDDYEHANWSEKLSDITWVHSNIPALSALLLNPSFANSSILPHLSAIHPSSLPGCLTDYLLRPTNRLQNMIDNLLPGKERNETTTVGIQVRLGDTVLQGGDDAEDEQEEEKGWRWHEDNLNSLLASQNEQGNPRFFVTSDSIRARDHFVNKLSPIGRVFASDLDPVHLNDVPEASFGEQDYFSYEGRAHQAHMALEATLAEVSHTSEV